mmetsp:Transcript_64310/g.94158  ORF Transcript_64310/g.94158 Transcript_64310/m.94158 type:complete len:234 (+) Transcript_64310:147-848(+)
MGDGLYHAVLLIVCHLSHKPKVEDGKTAIGSPQHVARVRVGVEEATLEQLREIGDHAHGHQRRHITRCALGELLSIHPRCNMHSTRGERGEALGYNDLRDVLHDFFKLEAVGALVYIVELAVETWRELVQERHKVGVGFECGHKLGGLAHEEQVERDCLQNVGPLHFDSNRLPALAQHPLIHLPERGSSKRPRRKLRKHGLDFGSEFVLDGFTREIVVEGRDFVAQTLQLVHR